MKYLIAIMLPSNIAAAVSALQKKYKPKRWHIRIGPHITLVHRGDLRHGSESELIETLKIAALYFPPFEIATTHISTFNRRQKIVVATVTKTAKLMQLQAMVVKAASQFLTSDDGYSKIGEYTPHITLANRLEANEAAKILPDLQKEEVAFTFPCTGFALFKRSELDEMWREVEQFHFERSGKPPKVYFERSEKTQKVPLEEQNHGKTGRSHNQEERNH